MTVIVKQALQKHEDPAAIAATQKMVQTLVRTAATSKASPSGDVAKSKLALNRLLNAENGLDGFVDTHKLTAVSKVLDTLRSGNPQDLAHRLETSKKEDQKSVAKEILQLDEVQRTALAQARDALDPAKRADLDAALVFAIDGVEAAGSLGESAQAQVLAGLLVDHPVFGKDAKSVRELSRESARLERLQAMRGKSGKTLTPAEASLMTNVHKELNRAAHRLLTDPTLAGHLSGSMNVEYDSSDMSVVTNMVGDLSPLFKELALDSKEQVRALEEVGVGKMLLPKAAPALRDRSWLTHLMPAELKAQAAALSESLGTPTRRAAAG